MQYTFVLGNAFDLAQAELVAVLNSWSIPFSIESAQQPLLTISTQEEISPEKLMSVLGGTIKIARNIAEIPLVSQILAETIASFITKSENFGISNHARITTSLSKLLQEIKALLTKKGIAARYVLPKDKSQLSSVVISKQHLTEFIISENREKNKWLLWQTLVVQDSDDWSKRDYSRPYADSKLGMLPPKVARMMVNLASSMRSQDTSKKSFTILDPFCGMGTVLAEALMVENEVIGSDILKDVVVKAEKNINWLKKSYPQTQDLKTSFLHADAVHISEHIPHQTIDAIVTEPFMGTPFETRENTLFLKGKKADQQMVENTIKGLEKLYIGAFKDWHLILKANGIIVIALPSITFSKREYFVKNLVDKCEKLGYTIPQDIYIYSRPQAVVKRNIYVFKKN